MLLSPRCHRYADHEAHQRRARGLHVQRLPQAMGEPRYVLALGYQGRRQYALALSYSQSTISYVHRPLDVCSGLALAQAHMMPFFLPDSLAMEAWTRAMFWHPSTAHLLHFTAAVHQDLLDRRVTRSNSSAAIASVVRCFETLRHELSTPTVSLEMTLLTVGLLCTHNLTEEKMQAMYATPPLCFEPVVPRDPKWRVIQQLSPDATHLNMMVYLTDKLGGLRKLRMPGLASTKAYVDLHHASKSAQHPRLECLWVYDSGWLPSLTSTYSNAGNNGSTGSEPGSGFFIAAFAGLTPAARATLTRLSAMNQRLQVMSSAGELTSGNADDVGGIWHARNALQHQLLSLPRWEELTLGEQALADETVYRTCILAAIIYSNAALFDIPCQSGWHTSLARKLRSVLEDACWPSATQSVHLWVLMIGGIAAAQSEHRLFYEQELSKLLDEMGQPSWTAAERILQGFLWSSKACRHGSAALWQAM